MQRRDTADRIRASARREIELYGIVGLRITRLARGAGCSVTQIYRHFDNRDGVLADVLAGVFRATASTTLDSLFASIRTTRPSTPRDLADALVTPVVPRTKPSSGLLFQVLAYAGTNPAFRRRLDSITAELRGRWLEEFGAATSTIDFEPRVDPGPLFTAVMNHHLFRSPFDPIIGNETVDGATMINVLLRVGPSSLTPT